ncbi:tetratricopeptide repeat protein [Lysobacter erysipheiresistens]|uniref:Tetratricopeptide repeat protein n=2 Tax=Novilysobacter erysipheiresistens TaxID=1749332 RepID=A0ABU7YY02_9GAMM
MYEPIIDALRRGAADEALAAAREATTDRPHDPVAQRLLAGALRLRGDRDGALAAIDAAIALAPDDANLHLDRAGLLLHARQLDQAETALARSIGLDPNQFPAYILQAQLALGRGDLDEAARLIRTAARIAPQHPQIAALEGSLALRSGDGDRALAILSQADARFPDEPVLRHALAFAYVAKGHLAFAEQAFRKLLENDPDSLPLRALIADLVCRQGRAADAATELAPVLDNPAATPALRRMLGEIELQAGHNERAVELLREALIAQPGDRRAIVAATEAWRRLDDADGARATLDPLLAEHPQYLDLWRARLAFETFAGDAAREVIARWRAAQPDSIAAMQAQIAVHDVAGESDQAEALARRIVELQPGHPQAELRIVDGLLARDPAAAISHVEGLIAKADGELAKRQLRQLLGVVLGAAGRHAEAVATWAALNAEVVSQRLPLPPTSAKRSDWPELAIPEPGAPPMVLLWGAPGSLVERLAATLSDAGAPLRSDRFGPRPPADLFQRYLTVDALTGGSADPAALVAEWRAALPTRGIRDGQQIFDWLLWWDNAALLALRPHLPEAELLIAVRDPRDMLLDWLACGTPAPFALESPEAGAQWLARVLDQVADLHEDDLMPHRLLRMDGISDDPAGIAQALAEALKARVPAVPHARFGGRRFAAGHWRVYAEPLAAAFEALHPVARRLGYADA